jgi:hypothetical protein
MKLFQSKTFAAMAMIVIATQLLAACAGAATQAPLPEATEVHTMPMTGEAEAGPTDSATATDPLTFKQAMRQLWEDHILWTRVYIIDVAADRPERDATAERLLQNQTDIGNAIEPYYGEEAAGELTALLNQHITGAVDLLDSAKSGDTAMFDQAKTSWYNNANEIAAFLSTANPDNWPQAEMEAMMKSHLDLTLEEATARLNGDWAADAAAYDKVHEDILGMADMLSDGIVNQFPEQFGEAASPQQTELTLAMDKLWEDHITWTRMYIISVTSDLPDADVAAERLLQNQVDIGDAIKPYYGDEAGNQLTTLLNEHIMGAVDLLAAAKSGDTAMFDQAKTAWYDNANQIAAFLSTANPDNWPQAEMEAMMQAHLDLTLEEATARLNGDWAGDIAAYDEIHVQILDMAGMLTQGILTQFPV